MKLILEKNKNEERKRSKKKIKGRDRAGRRGGEAVRHARAPRLHITRGSHNNYYDT